MAQSVNYGAGRENMGSLYGNLRQAIANKGAAENLAKQGEIDRKGLFGSGIRTEDIRGLTETGLSIAEFGQKRMEGQMDRATKSYDRRKAADERRLATLQNRLDKGQLDKAGLAEMDGIQMGMTERRNKFEDTLGEYRGKGLWGTGFGGDEVGYRTEGESKWSKGERSKPGPGSGPVGGDPWTPGVSDTQDSSIEGSGRAPWERSGPTAQSSPGQSEFEDKFGRGPIGAPKQSSYGRSEFGDKHGKAWEQYDPDLAEQGFLGSNFGKKKDDLGGQVASTSGQELRDIASEKDTAHMRAQPSPTAWRSNFYNEKPSDMRMPGVLRNLTQNQRDRMDVLEKQGLIKEKEQALGQNELEQKQMIEKMLAKRQRNKLTEALRETDWKRG